MKYQALNPFDMNEIDENLFDSKNLLVFLLHPVYSVLTENNEMIWTNFLQ